MHFQWFLEFPTSLAALVSGILFGFLLKKAHVNRFEVIIGQLTLKDFTVMKVIFTAIVTGGLGIYIFKYLGYIPSLHLSTTPLFLSLIGGSIFGVGMSLLGYCPGTAIAAIAEKTSKDLYYGFAGMCLGSILFNEISKWLKPYTSYVDAAYMKNIPSYFGVPTWLVFCGLMILWIAFFNYFRKKEVPASNS